MATSSSAESQARRDFLRDVAAVAAGLLSMSPLRSLDALSQPPKAMMPPVPRAMTIYKDPNCGCCKEWVKHVKAAGFTTTVHDTADMPTVRASMGVPSSLQSCHTARVGNYTIEGHVPADLIERLLREKPVAVGLAVPGMVVGSPGMEVGAKKDKYDVLIFEKSGKSRVYASR
jgi:hypothetical protein